MYKLLNTLHTSILHRAILADADRKSSISSSSSSSLKPSNQPIYYDSKTTSKSTGGHRMDGNTSSSRTDGSKLTDKGSSSSNHDNTTSNPMRRPTRRLSVRENILEEKIAQHKKSSTAMTTPEVDVGM
jgi:hypothetical protein